MNGAEVRESADRVVTRNQETGKKQMQQCFQYSKNKDVCETVEGKGVG